MNQQLKDLQAGYGYGDGHGDGNGCGDGNGNGYGHGYGSISNETILTLTDFLKGKNK